MTDTSVLDAMMRTLARNPLVDDRMRHPLAPLGSPLSQYIQTDERPFYAKKEATPTAEMNRNYGEVADLFHQDINSVRLERPRRGSCPAIRREQTVIDGKTWTREEGCTGTVHAVETVANGAIRVDGRCLTCGWEVHRAGLLNEKG